MSGWRRSTVDRLTRAVVRLAALVLVVLIVAAVCGCQTVPAARQDGGIVPAWDGRCVAADPVVVQAATGADVSAAVWPGLATADPWALVGGLRLMGGRRAWWAETAPLRR